MSKTCGECRYFKNGKCYFFHNTRVCAESIHPCWYFKPKPTNGDKIRGMSNEELAKTLPICKLCAYYGKCLTDTDKIGQCYNGRLEYLNAPADCVKQNGNHHTQADLCKVDNTESGGEDE